MIDVGKTITVYFFAKCLKMYSFFAFVQKVLIIISAKRFLGQKSIPVSKIAESYADFQSVDASFKKCSYKSYKLKATKKYTKTKRLKFE
jgi:hypothetical protein